MQSQLRGMAAVAILGIVLYAAAALWISRSIDQQVESLSAILIAQDEVMVTRLEYAGGMFSGMLHYDLVWRPEQAELRDLASTLGEFLQEDTSPGSLRLKGSLEVRHGPWVGRSAGFAAATSEILIPLPETLRPLLPQYPAAKPLLRLTLLRSLTGQLGADLHLVDYDGRLIDPGSSSIASLTIAGVKASMRIDPTLDRVSLTVHGDQLGLQNREENTKVLLSGILLHIDQHEALTDLWIGSQSLRVDTLEVESGDEQIKLEGLLFGSDGQISRGQYAHAITMALAGASVGEYRVGASRLELSLSQIDAPALADLQRLLADDYLLSSGKRDLAAVIEPMAAIARGNPRLAVDQLGLSLTGREDLSATLSLQLIDLPPDEPLTAESLLAALRVEAEARLSTEALATVIRAYLAGESGGESGERALDAQAQLMVAELLDTLEGQPAISVGEQEISSSVRVTEGRLQLGSGDVVDMSEWMPAALGLLGSALTRLGGDTLGHTSDGFRSDGLASGLDHSAEPLWPREFLASGFLPDPRVINLVAGGQDNVAELLGEECVGYVTASQPDAVVEYTAGSFNLYVYVQSFEDTTLIARDPRGNWHCNDDAPGLGLNPGLEFATPLSGSYVIWVGTYNPGTAEAQLYLSEVGIGN